MRTLLSCAVLLLASVAMGQLTLVVDGRDVPGVTSVLVPGSSYAPAGELAAAIGAELFVDSTGARVTLTMGGRILTLDVVDAGAGALAGSGSLDGAEVATGSAVRDGVEMFLPVKGVVEAFGGSVAYLSAENRVVGVLPRAEVLDASLERVAGAERLRLRLSAPVPYSSFENAALGSMQVRFARASVARARTLEGDAFLRVDVIPGPGVVDVRIQLAPGVVANMAALPAGAGFEWIVQTRATQDAAVETAERPTIVIDAGHGGDDDGIRFPGGAAEDALTLAFTERLVAALKARRVDVSATRSGDEPVSIESRSAAGVDADLFLSVHAADLPAGQFRVYFLGEADAVEQMDFAMRENASAELAGGVTDEVRRQILLDLAPDLAVGRRYAAALGNQLFQVGGYRSADTRSAPLAVLAGAAGRGLLIELAPADLASDALPELLASTLLSLLGSGGFE